MIVLALLLAAVAIAFYLIYRRKKYGSACCGGISTGCSGCTGCSPGRGSSKDIVKNSCTGKSSSAVTGKSADGPSGGNTKCNVSSQNSVAVADSPLNGPSGSWTDGRESADDRIKVHGGGNNKSTGGKIRIDHAGRDTAPAALTDITLELTLGGMTCAHCASRIEKALNALPGLKAKVSYEKGTARVTYRGSQDERALIDDIRAAISEAGYVLLSRQTIS